MPTAKRKPLTDVDGNRVARRRRRNKEKSSSASSESSSIESLVDDSEFAFLTDEKIAAMTELSTKTPKISNCSNNKDGETNSRSKTPKISNVSDDALAVVHQKVQPTHKVPRVVKAAPKAATKAPRFASKKEHKPDRRSLVDPTSQKQQHARTRRRTHPRAGDLQSLQRSTLETIHEAEREESSDEEPPRREKMALGRSAAVNGSTSMSTAPTDATIDFETPLDTAHEETVVYGNQIPVKERKSAPETSLQPNDLQHAAASQFKTPVVGMPQGNEMDRCQRSTGSRSSARLAVQQKRKHQQREAGGVLESLPPPEPKKEKQESLGRSLGRHGGLVADDDDMDLESDDGSLAPSSPDVEQRRTTSTTDSPRTPALDEEEALLTQSSEVLNHESMNLFKPDNEEVFRAMMAKPDTPQTQSSSPLGLIVQTTRKEKNDEEDSLDGSVLTQEDFSSLPKNGQERQVKVQDSTPTPQERKAEVRASTPIPYFSGVPFAGARHLGRGVHTKKAHLPTTKNPSASRQQMGSERDSKKVQSLAAAKTNESDTLRQKPPNIPRKPTNSELVEQGKDRWSSRDSMKADSMAIRDPAPSHGNDYVLATKPPKIPRKPTHSRVESSENSQVHRNRQFESTTKRDPLPRYTAPSSGGNKAGATMAQPVIGPSAKQVAASLTKEVARKPDPPGTTTPVNRHDRQRAVMKREDPPSLASEGRQSSHLEQLETLRNNSTVLENESVTSKQTGQKNKEGGLVIQSRRSEAYGKAEKDTPSTLTQDDFSRTVFQRVQVEENAASTAAESVDARNSRHSSVSTEDQTMVHANGHSSGQRNAAKSESVPTRRGKDFALQQGSPLNTTRTGSTGKEERKQPEREGSVAASSGTGSSFQIREANHGRNSSRRFHENAVLSATSKEEKRLLDSIEKERVFALSSRNLGSISKRPNLWTADLAGRTYKALGINLAPVFRLSDGQYYQHPPLPPGWTLAVSQSKDQPFYLHPDFGVSFYSPVPLPGVDGTIVGTTQVVSVDPGSPHAGRSIGSFSHSTGGFNTPLPMGWTFPSSESIARSSSRYTSETHRRDDSSQSTVTPLGALALSACATFSDPLRRAVFSAASQATSKGSRSSMQFSEAADEASNANGSGSFAETASGTTRTSASDLFAGDFISVACERRRDEDVPPVVEIVAGGGAHENGKLERSPYESVVATGEPTESGISAPELTEGGAAGDEPKKSPGEDDKTAETEADSLDLSGHDSILSSSSETCSQDGKRAEEDPASEAGIARQSATNQRDIVVPIGDIAPEPSQPVLLSQLYPQPAENEMYDEFPDFDGHDDEAVFATSDAPSSERDPHTGGSEPEVVSHQSPFPTGGYSPMMDAGSDEDRSPDASTTSVDGHIDIVARASKISTRFSPTVLPRADSFDDGVSALGEDDISRQGTDDQSLSSAGSRSWTSNLSNASRMSYRVLHPPMPVCSLQNIDALPVVVSTKKSKKKSKSKDTKKKKVKSKKKYGKSRSRSRPIPERISF